MDATNQHILIIEDDEDTRFVYSVLLQMEGYLVTHVGTMAEAISRILSTNYDLIIMDVRLPDGDGVDLCFQIRSFNKITPIMFVSAAAFEKDVERGMKAGAQAYMTKPADANKLLENVAYLLGKKAMPHMHWDSASLNVLVTTAGVAAALIDENRVYKAVSPTYAAAGGCMADDLVGKPLTNIFPDVSGTTVNMLERVWQTKQPFFLSRYPYTLPERGVTYWDAAMWPIDRSESGTDILIVVRQKEQSGDILASV
ncbi:MAG TPA: response regulator [Blastocatellia bacterium]|nr:response regulator [Blastocatellia bacterium]